jgi:hypothetical protein
MRSHRYCATVFVDEQIAQPPVVLGENFGLLLEQFEIVQKQIAEIARVERQQTPLVHRVEFGQASARQIDDGVGVGFGAQLVGGEPAILPALDRRIHEARRPFLVVDVFGLQQLLHETDLVVLVEDREIGLEADKFGMAAQDARGKRMEGAEPHGACRIADERPDARAHLGRRLVRERHGHDLARERLALHEQMHDARDQHPRFAGSRPREHEQRAFGRNDRLALLRIERAQIGRFADRHGRRFGGWIHGPAIQH